MANNPFGGVPQQNMSAPTGQIQGGNFAAPQPFNAGSGNMQRNWGPSTNPPQQDSMLAQGINAWMMNPANRNNYYNYRAGRGGGGGGRGFWGRGRKQQQQQQQQNQNPMNQYTFNINQNPTFGDQSNLGRQDFGSVHMSGMSSTQPTGQGTAGSQVPLGQNPAGQNPRQRQPLTQQQKQRNAETARARRALASDIKKNGTPEQQQRIQQEGVAGGKNRQPRQPRQSTTATQPPSSSQPPPSSSATNTSSNTNYAPQVYAPRNNFGGSAQGTAGAAGRPFISLPGSTGGNAQSGRNTSAQGADFDRLNIY